MKKNRGVLVIVLITITILVVGCKSTKIILPMEYYYLTFVESFNVYLNDTSDNNKFFSNKDTMLIAVIYQIQTTMSGDDIFCIIKENGGTFPNEQGLRLVWEQKKDSFPAGKYVAGFPAKKKQLRKGYGKSQHGVVCVFKYNDSNNHWLFDIACFEKSWSQNYCILFFVPANTKLEEKLFKSLPK